MRCHPLLSVFSELTTGEWKMCEYVFLCLDNFGYSASQVIGNFKLRELVSEFLSSWRIHENTSFFG